MKKEELVANLGTIARSGSKVSVFHFHPHCRLIRPNTIKKPLTGTRICNVSHKHHLCTHCRPFWMPCRTKQRPAAPSLVSSGWDSTLPSWWPTALTSTPSPLSLTHPDTIGPQMGENRGRDAFQFNIKQSYLSVIQQPCLSLAPSAPECLRSPKPAAFNGEQRSCCTLRRTAKSFPQRTE